MSDTEELLNFCRLPFFRLFLGQARNRLLIIKNMIYQIDQSGKIEQTSKNTVIGISNSLQKSIILKAKEKRALKDIYRTAGKPKVFVVQVFSALIYLLLENAKIEKGVVYIDKEYPGHEDIIKSYINQLIGKRAKIHLDPHNIRFTLVGKTSNVHLFTYKEYRKGKANFKARKEDILAMALNYER